jgi:hypothetical protein
MPDGKRRRNAVTIAFGDGVNTYPVNGVPLPARGLFGMVRFLERLLLDSPSPGDGFVYKWDSINNSIRIYESAGVVGPLVELTAANTPAATTLYATAQGW